MATQSSETLQIVNADLATERQTLLRQKLSEYFTALGKRTKQNRRLVYTLNRENTSAEQVLRINDEADALFTAFNYDVQTAGATGDVTVSSEAELARIDPELRYPYVATLNRMVDGGTFRHRKLILVGDIHAKLLQYLKSGLPVEVTAFTDAGRSKLCEPFRLEDSAKLVREGDGVYSADGPLAVTAINSLVVAGIPFDGIVNMPEENNKFVLKDQTLLDTTRKLFFMQGVRDLQVQERVQEEKLTFVRGKKVLIVLDPDLEHVISDRLVFDRMQNLWRCHTVEKALEVLETGRSKGILDYFDSHGYEMIFDALNQDERDKVMLAILGDSLPDVAARELQQQKAMLAQLDDSDLQNLYYQLPAKLLDETLDGLKAKSYEKFLALVPPKIRENVIINFLSSAEHVNAAWKAIDPKEQQSFLQANQHNLMATQYLLNTNQFRNIFGDLQFEFQDNYNSDKLASLSEKEQSQTLSLLAKSLAKANLPKGLLGEKMPKPVVNELLSEWVIRASAEFYNQLSPVVRKDMWVTVAQQYRDEINTNLHVLDKVEILQGNKDTALQLLTANAGLSAFIKGNENPEFNRTLLLNLKKLNKAESKTALLKKLLADPKVAEQRKKGLESLLADEEEGSLYEKLAEYNDELEFRFDSLICTQADLEQLKDQEPLQGAVVTIVDQLVDTTLFDLFQRGKLSRDEYKSFSQTVEDKIAALRKQMAEREGEDPVGVYLLESMVVLNEMSNQVLAGKLDNAAVERLDERRKVRQRMIEAFKGHLERIEVFLSKAGKQKAALEEKITQAKGVFNRMETATDKAYQEAQALMKEVEKLAQGMKRLDGEKVKVARTQKELSVQFFELIQPLILEKVRSLSLGSLLRKIGLGGKESPVSQKRVIFRFSDEEIERILRYKVVFAARDRILNQFVATCLRIDNLQDSLFSLATLETLPKDNIDILFVAGYTPDEVTHRVKLNRVVEFADEAFLNRLTANEKLKARTKALLVRSTGELKAKRAALDKAGTALKAQQAKKRDVQQALLKLQNDLNSLIESEKRQKERQHNYKSEQELLDSRMDELDGKFDAVKAKVTAALESAEGASAELESGQSALADQLKDEFVEMNKELAHLMLIKGVKDAGAQISQNTQQEIQNRIEQRELYDYRQHPFRKMLIADDGSQNAKTIKQAFINAALNHFKIRDTALEDMTIPRLVSRVENYNEKQMPFMVVISDRGDALNDLKQTVKKMRMTLPAAYQLVFAPLGEFWKLPPGDETVRNVNALKEHCTLINTAITDYTEQAAAAKVLTEKAPMA